MLVALLCGGQRVLIVLFFEKTFSISVGGTAMWRAESVLVALLCGGQRVNVTLMIKER